MNLVNVVETFKSIKNVDKKDIRDTAIFLGCLAIGNFIINQMDKADDDEEETNESTIVVNNVEEANNG